MGRPRVSSFFSPDTLWTRQVNYAKIKQKEKKLKLKKNGENKKFLVKCR